MGLVNVVQVAYKDNIADILTKGLGKHLHWSCSVKFGLTFLSSPSICGKADKHEDQDSNDTTKTAKVMSVQGGGGLMRILVLMHVPC